MINNRSPIVLSIVHDKIFYWTCPTCTVKILTSLVVNLAPVRKDATKIFTSTYDNFIQTGGIRDVTSHYAKILSAIYDTLDTSHHNDPDVIIKIDTSE